MSSVAHHSPSPAERRPSPAPADTGAGALIFAFLIPIVLVTSGIWAAGHVNGTGALIGVLALDVLCTVFVTRVTISYLRRDD